MKEWDKLINFSTQKGRNTTTNQAGGKNEETEVN